MSITRFRSARNTGGHFVNLVQGNNVIRYQRSHLIASYNYATLRNFNFIMHFAVRDSRVSSDGHYQGWTNVLQLFLSLPYNQKGEKGYFENMFAQMKHVYELIAGGDLVDNKHSLKMLFPKEFTDLLKNKNLRCFLIAAKFVKPATEEIR